MDNVKVDSNGMITSITIVSSYRNPIWKETLKEQYKDRNPTYFGDRNEPYGDF